MLAFGLSLLLGLWWFFAGRAVLAAIAPPMDRLRQALISPAVGIIATLMPVFLINRYGVGVSVFGAAAAGLMVIVVAALWVWKKPQVPWTSVLPIAAITAVGGLLSAWPMFRFGFDWVSYCNDDMVNYSAGAQRFLYGGFLQMPDVQRIAEGRDWGSLSWMLYVPGLSRAGCELLLAWVTTWTGLTAHQVFMPLIMSFHLALIPSAASLAVAGESDRKRAITLAGMLAVSALLTLGMNYQLIAQVSGLSVLTAATATILRPLTDLSRSAVIRHGVLVGVLAAGLFLIYPEVGPFMVLAMGLYAGVAWWKDRTRLAGMGKALLAGAVAAVVLINIHLWPHGAYVVFQALSGSMSAEPTRALFPYYLVPSGLSAFWGLQPIVPLMIPDPYQSITIAAGIALTLVLIVLAVRQMLRGEPAATMTTAMLAMGFYLFFKLADFGLFKLAMFIQPFVLGTLVVAAWSLRTARWRRAALVGLGLLSVAGLRAQWKYVESSTGGGASFVEVIGASETGLITRLARDIDPTDSRPLICDTPNVVAAKFFAFYGRGRPLIYPSGRFFINVQAMADGRMGLMSPAVRAMFETILKVVYNTSDDREFDLHDPSAAVPTNRFPQAKFPPDAITGPMQVLVSGPMQSVLNRANPIGSDPNHSIVDGDNVRNLLIFVGSHLGDHYFRRMRDVRHGMYQVEAEPFFFPGERFAGVGRHLLFEVIHPDAQPRMVIELTTSYLADGDNRLPPARVIGTARTPIGLVGRGSARVYSQPVSPQMFDGRPYVAIDMGAEGKQIQHRRKGLMSLWGSGVSLDTRFLTGFARNISLVGEHQYASLPVPSEVSSFPAGLADVGLEYSGLFEDGWVAEQAFIVLQRDAATRAQVRGMVPMIDDEDFSVNAVMSVDGEDVKSATLGLGEFVLEGSLPPGSGRRRVEIRFDRTQRLPGGDNRPVAALIHRIALDGGGDVDVRPATPRPATAEPRLNPSAADPG